MDAIADICPDNGEAMIIWVGSGASPQLLVDLFDVDDIKQINTQMVSFILI